jgi:hypothetical protein
MSDRLPTRSAILGAPGTVEVLSETGAGESPRDRAHEEAHFRSVEKSDLLHRHLTDRSWVDLVPELIGQPLDHAEQLFRLNVLLDAHRHTPRDTAMYLHQRRLMLSVRCRPSILPSG